MGKSELIKLLKIHSERLFNLVDAGYAEAFAKAMGNIPLSAKELKMLELYKEETKELLRLVDEIGDYQE